MKDQEPKILNRGIVLKDEDEKKKPKHNLGFNVPVKILIVDNKRDYCEKVWYSICIGLSQLLIGATNMTTFIYSIKTGDSHAIVCSIGYHFFSAEAILALNYMNGWSVPIKARHRQLIHVFLQICAIVCIITGSVLVIFEKGLSLSAHGLLGIIAAVLAVVSSLGGLVAYFKQKMKTVHRTCGLLTFVLSSISFCFGIFTEPFKKWSDPPVRFMMLGFISFFTVIIIVKAFLKCMSKL